MDAAGLTLQAASPMPELLSYWMEAQDALDLTRWLNEVLAEMAGASGERIIALGAVPLQDVDLACRELERLMAEPAFAGVEIGSNVNGRPIGAPEYEPFFALAEALGAAVFVHALRPTGMDRLVGPPALQQVLAYPTDVGLAAASVITTNLVVRHPKLRLAFSHGGGTLTSLLPRLERACEVFPKLGEQVIERPSAQARRLWADSLVFDAPMLRRVVSVFGEDRVMIGTDYPFNFRDADPLARLAAAVDDPALRRRLAVDNAMCFLGRKGDLG